MNKSRLRFVLIWDNSTKLKQFQLTLSQLIVVFFLITLIFVSSFIYTVKVVSDVVYQHRLKTIIRNNQKLLSTIDNLHKKLGEMEKQLATIEEKDRAIRLYANFPEVDQDVRKLGIGGNRYEEMVELDKLLPGNADKISQLQIDTENLMREIKLETLSFESIYDKVKEREDYLASIPSIRPVEEGYLTDGFGYRRDPFTGEVRFHYGVDISARMYTKVYAPADGIIRYAKYKGGYGKCIKIDHGYGYSTIFAHLSRFHVKQGDYVKRGQIIAEVGNTGRSTAPHLHYEIHHNNVPVNPINFFFPSELTKK